jgi:hypothetical protein
MHKPLERRLNRLERNNALASPWHLPVDQWTDAQLLAIAAHGRTDIGDDELAEIAKGAAP